MNSVDVIVPCYKYACFLRDCVTSVLSQEGVDVRVLIIDDCSPDNTPKVAAQLVAEDSRVEYRRHATNHGHIATFNEGMLEWARAEYSLLLSADDMLTPGAFTRAVRLLDQHPDAGIAYGRAVCTANPMFSATTSDEGPLSCVIPGRQFIQLSCEEATNLVPTPTAVVRTSTQQRLGGYRKDLPHTHDMEMWFRFAARGAVGVIDCTQAYYRLHGANMSASYRGLADLQEKKAAFDALLSELKVEPAELAMLRRMACNALADQACIMAACLFAEGAPTKDVQPFLQFAEEICPTAYRRRELLSLRCKMLLGATTSRHVAAALNMLRGGHRRGAPVHCGGPRSWLRSAWVSGES